MATLVKVGRTKRVGCESSESLITATVPLGIAKATDVAFIVGRHLAARPQCIAAAADVSVLGTVVVERFFFHVLGAAELVRHAWRGEGVIRQSLAERVFVGPATKPDVFRCVDSTVDVDASITTACLCCVTRSSHVALGVGHARRCLVSEVGTVALLAVLDATEIVPVGVDAVRLAALYGHLFLPFRVICECSPAVDKVIVATKHAEALDDLGLRGRGCRRSR